MSFSKTYLESLPIKAHRYYVHCGTVPGLGLAVYPSGVKRFFWRRKNRDMDTGRIVLGIWQDGRIQDMTIKQAADKCDELNRLFNSGVNPATKDANTFANFFDKYMANHAKPNKATWKGNDLSIYKNHLKPLYDRPLAAIRPSEILDIFTGIVSAGHAPQANKTLALVRKVFECALDWGVLPDGHRNPAARIKKIKTVPRNRYLEKSEFPDFIRALTSYPHRAPREIILVAMFTGQRIGNVCAMRWADVNLEESVWNIPVTKSGHPSRVPLAQVVADLLTLRLDDYKLADSRADANVRPSQAARSASRRERMLPFVFRGRGAAGHYGYTGAYKAWRQVCESAGIVGLRAHDFRRTFGTINATNGTNMAVASRLLSHRQISTTAEIYTIVEQDPMREAVERTAATIIEFSEGKKDAPEARSTNDKDHGRDVGSGGVGV